MKYLAYFPHRYNIFQRKEFLWNLSKLNNVIFANGTCVFDKSNLILNGDAEINVSLWKVLVVIVEMILFLPKSHCTRATTYFQYTLRNQNFRFG